MTQEENVLLNKCAITRQEMVRIAAHYQSAIGDCPAIIEKLMKTEKRSKEYENGTFIILAVGPVKSGKSTLVNLIANAYVSPTHFLECTVRPSIISQRHEGEDSKITVFTCDNTADRAELIDAVIDCIRGIESEDSLIGVSKGVFDLTPQTIKEKVELGLKESLSSDTLVTSITTPGGKLMRQNVFIIDMPGFDGEYANIDNPIYDTIAQRADLIIFVQSSNSAISKVSSQFLKKLSDNNKDVPVCLIHNIFDSAWWRTEEERATATSSQKDFAVREIRRLGFHIDETQCFSINLGMVEDGRKNLYTNTQKLKSEVAEYDKIEDILYERVINRRDTMRLQVCLSRTRQQIEKTITAISEELSHRSQLTERYENVIAEFGKQKSAPDHRYRKPLTVDMTFMKQLIRDEAKSRISLVDTDNNHKSDSAVKGIVFHFVEACEKSISASLNRSLSLELKEEELAFDCRERIRKIKETVLNCESKPQPIDIELQHIGIVPEISLMNGIDLDLLIPRKPRIWMMITWWGGHSAEDVVGYLNKATERLAGSLPNDPDHLEGYIEKEGGALRPVIDQMNTRMEEIAQKYDAICEDYWHKSRDMVLESIIKNKSAFDKETEQLKCLRQELTNIKERT